MAWWPIAWSGDLESKPLAARVGSEEIVLFRGHSRHPYAFEDRCPHRRVPLSRGRVTPEGALQCGYHGWTYDGASGRCAAIPNFRPDESIPRKIRVRTYGVAEIDGLLFVQLNNANQATSELPPRPNTDTLAGPVQCGAESVNIAHAQWLELLVGCPSDVLGLCGFNGAKMITIAQDAISFEYSLSLISGAKNVPPTWRHARALRCNAYIWQPSGLAQWIIVDERGMVLTSILMSSTPTAQNQTQVQWRTRIGESPGTLRTLIYRLRTRGLPPLVRIAYSNPAECKDDQAVAAWRRFLNQRRENVDLEDAKNANADRTI